MSDEATHITVEYSVEVTVTEASPAPTEEDIQFAILRYCAGLADITRIVVQRS